MPSALRLTETPPSFTATRAELYRARQAGELRPLLDEVRTLLEQASTRLIGDEKSTLALLVRATERLANAVDLLAAPVITPVAAEGADRLTGQR